MNTSYSLDAYRAHDLNIAMKTSSGDVIKMDFSNEQSLSMSSSKTEKNSSASLSFSSMASFNFSMDSNGIDEQDKKEIKAFMKVAQPFIDKFLKELDDGSQESPMSKIAKQVADVFQPINDKATNQTNKANEEHPQKNENIHNFAKNSIVQMFDNAAKQIKSIDQIFADAQKLLEKTLHEFDKINKEDKSIYA